MTPEGRVKAKVKKVLEKHGVYSFMPVQSGLGSKTLDFLVCAGGYFLAIETKAEGKELTKLQRVTAEVITKAGGVVFCIEGVNDKKIDLLDKFLTRILLNPR